MTEEERRKIASENMAKYMCVIAGFDPVDSMDGGANWFMFYNEAEKIYDDIRRRFPPPPSEEVKP